MKSTMTITMLIWTLGLSTVLLLGMVSFSAPVANGDHDGNLDVAGQSKRTSNLLNSENLDSTAEDGPDEAIEQAMEEIHRGGKAVRRALRKKQVDAALLAISIAQKGVVEAKKLVPSAALKLEGEAQARMKADYRKRLIEVLEKWLQVEKLLIDGKLEEAATTMKEISELEKSGHKEYEVED
jgi:soluble cytochrome b562